VTDAPIAGWYPDPRNADAQWRWWDGRAWTHQTVDRVAAPVRQAQDWGWSTPTTYTPPEITGSPNTPWIWILAFFGPLYGVVAGLLQGGALLAFGRDITTAQLVGGVALLVALIPFWVFADLDGRLLRQRGIEAPSVLWMLLLPPLLYFVVRARKLRRRELRSKGPDTAAFIVYAVQVLGGVLAAVFAVLVLQGLTGTAIG